MRKKDGNDYPPHSLLHLCSGIVRYLHSNGHPSLDVYKDPLFAEFQMTLDAEMQSKGLRSNCKQVEPISEEEEELLWTMGLLDNHNPQALLNTMVFMTGLYFALRSGKEHRELRYNSQIETFNGDCERSDLLYTKDSPTNHPGGLRGQHEYVKHHANTDNTKRCLVRFYQKYRDLCLPTQKTTLFTSNL